MSQKKLAEGWCELSRGERTRLQAAFPNSVLRDMVRHPGHGLVMPRVFLNIADKVRNFPLREDDIWVVTFPKSGTTLTQEMIWMIVNDVDKERGKESVGTRSPFLEVESVWDPDFMTDNITMTFPEHIPKEVVQNIERWMKDPIRFVGELKGRRVIKSHLPLQLLPAGLLHQCKVVYVARNPMDTAVSWHHHNVIMPGQEYKGTFEEFLDMFLEDLQFYGSYWSHVLAAWRLRQHPNFRMLWFEFYDNGRTNTACIKAKQFRSTILSLCEFLEHPLQEEKVSELVEHLSFDNMKRNPAVDLTLGINNRDDFLRKGKVGDWRQHLTQQRVEQFTKWMEYNTRDAQDIRNRISFA